MRIGITLTIMAMFISVFFQNCAGGFDVQAATAAETETVIHDPAFDSFIQEFAENYKQDIKIPITFAELDENKAGVCYRNWVGHKLTGAYIKIDRQEWPRMSILQQKNLIFHELGHCIQMRDHVDPSGVLECPISFMHLQVMTRYCLEKNWDVYMKEMFP